MKRKMTKKKIAGEIPYIRLSPFQIVGTIQPSQIKSTFRLRGAVTQIRLTSIFIKGLFLDGVHWDRDVQRPFGSAFRLKNLPKPMNLHDFLLKSIRDWLPISWLVVRKNIRPSDPAPLFPFLASSW
jgi:hypothetical protein